MPNKWDQVVGTDEYNENLSRITKIARDNGCSLNPDKERLEKVVGLMTMNKNEFGKYFCPCKQSHPLKVETDVLCPCPSLTQEIEEDGHCYCRLFFQGKQKEIT